MKKYFLNFSLLFVCHLAVADVKPNSLFTDHMVLQKGVKVPVWGTAEEGEKVSVVFNGQNVSTVAVNGKWLVELAPMPYVVKGAQMIISGKNTVSISDVLVGEVWLCSGQSNMARQLGPKKGQQLITDWENERNQADYPLIRSYNVPLAYSKDPIADANSSWKVCSPETVSEFSAVGYFFAKDLYKDLKIPIGIIFSAYGGTPAEDWTSRKGLANPDIADAVEKFESDNRKEDSISKAKKTWLRPLIPNGLYNAMIAPLLPVAIKGVAWYQGESNNGRAKQYQMILPNMIENWRTDFKQGDFPFLIVQIAPYKGQTPEIRESQLLVSQKVKNTALIVTTDCGDANDIHPANKQPVGTRLALAARKVAYKEDIESSGPIYRCHSTKKNKIILHFDHVTKGFLEQATPLKGFVIAGEDKNFLPGRATIKGNTIVISNDQIKKPVAVRYGWENVPDVNLYNAEGLPASPFRTDVQ